ncbi:hypothetical protein DICPUDRAFT_37110, partial [Dictyostelium purpureum]
QTSIPINKDIRNLFYSCKSALTLLVYCCPKSGKVLQIGFPSGDCKMILCY